MVGEEVLASEISSAALLQVFFGLAALAVLYIIFSSFWSAIDPSPKSRKARKLMVDLYVIGTIRKLAEKDGIDLEKEMKQIKIVEKWEKASRRDLDDVIETNLNERVNAENEVKLDEISKKK